MSDSIGAKRERRKPPFGSITVSSLFEQILTLFMGNEFRFILVQSPSTTSTTAIESTTETVSKKQRPPRTSSAYPPIQSSMITTESSRWVTFYQQTSAEVGVRTSSSNRPVQDVIYKNLSYFHRGHSASSPTAKCSLYLLIFIIHPIAGFTQVLTRFFCWARHAGKGRRYIVFSWCNITTMKVVDWTNPVLLMLIV